MSSFMFYMYSVSIVAFHVKFDVPLWIQLSLDNTIDKDAHTWSIVCYMKLQTSCGTVSSFCICVCHNKWRSYDIYLPCICVICDQESSFNTKNRCYFVSLKSISRELTLILKKKKAKNSGQCHIKKPVSIWAIVSTVVCPFLLRIQFFYTLP